MTRPHLQRSTLSKQKSRDLHRGLNTKVVTLIQRAFLIASVIARSSFSGVGSRSPVR